MKYKLFLFGDMVFESNDLLTVGAYKATLPEINKKHATIEENTLIKSSVSTTKKLKIWQDTMPVNPFEEWDCEPDLMSTNKDYSEGAIVEFIRDQATDGKVIYHQKAIAEILEIDLDYYVDLSKEDKASELNYEIRDANIEQLGELCEVFKLPFKQYTSRGYCQSSWADVLIVLTDEFFDRTGCKKKNSEEILEGTAKLFDQWAWGDVFGFSAVEVSTCDLGCEHEEIVDSCGGFYGNDFENNGMLDHLPKELHEQLKSFDHSEIEY